MNDQLEQVELCDLRCEGCGYSLEGMDPTWVCSECGLAIAKSLPRVRTGTPWQQRKGFRSLVTTWWRVLVNDECWREIQIDRSTRRSMLGWTRLLTYGFFALGISTQLLVDPDRGFLFVGVVFGVIGIEILTQGLRLINGFRLGLVTPIKEECQVQAAQDEVLEHASLGMLISLPFFVSVGMILLSIESFFSQSLSQFLLYFGFGLIIAGLPVGIIFSELIYRRGWRAMRYRTVTPLESCQVDPEHLTEVLYAE